jgi:hypothetical protein
MRTEPTTHSGRRVIALVVAALLLGAATSRADVPQHHAGAPASPSAAAPLQR